MSWYAPIPSCPPASQPALRAGNGSMLSRRTPCCRLQLAPCAAVHVGTLGAQSLPLTPEHAPCGAQVLRVPFYPGASPLRLSALQLQSLTFSQARAPPCPAAAQHCVLRAVLGRNMSPCLLGS